MTKDAICYKETSKQKLFVEYIWTVEKSILGWKDSQSFELHIIRKVIIQSLFKNMNKWHGIIIILGECPKSYRNYWGIVHVCF